MLNSAQISQLAAQILASLPKEGLDISKHLRASLHSALTKLDLVTREEFEVQSQVLARSRAKLEALEQQVAELEQRLIHKD